MINVFGNFSGDLGYNIHTREFFYALSAKEKATAVPFDRISREQYPLIAEAIGKEDVKNGPSICIGYGDQMARFAGKVRCGWTVWETTKLPEWWMNAVNQLDQLWVPSKWGAEVAKNSGVDVPIKVVPEGVSELFTPAAPKYPALDSETFKFLFIGKWEKRKNPELVIKAFLQEFGEDDNAELLMQAYNPFACTPEMWPAARMEFMWRSGIPFDARVRFVEPLSKHSQMPSLYTSCDAFVMPTSGEGWGLPIIEAMACGLPVIATNYSGQTEFMDEKLCFPVDVDHMEVAEEAPFISAREGSEWAVPSLESLRKQMRAVYDNQEHAKAVGKRASKHVLEKFSWKESAKRALGCLEALQ